MGSIAHQEMQAIQIPLFSTITAITRVQIPSGTPIKSIAQMKFERYHEKAGALRGLMQKYAVPHPSKTVLYFGSGNEPANTPSNLFTAYAM
jgi:hypothetical protein